MDDDSEIEINITTKQRILLDDYFDRAFIMAVLCNHTYAYYSRLKNLIQFPTILMTSILTILNSTDINNTENYYLKVLNIIINAIVTFLISLSAAYRFSEKANQFRLYATKFTKLEHVIESKIKISPHEIDTNFINACMQQYDRLVEELDLNFPEHIKNKVREQYKTIKTLPLFINGIAKNRNLVPLTPMHETISSNKKKVSPLILPMVDSSFVYDVPQDKNHQKLDIVVEEPPLLNLDGNINFRDRPISLNQLQEQLSISRTSSLESDRTVRNKSLSNIYDDKTRRKKQFEDIRRSKSSADIYNFSFDDERHDFAMQSYFT